MAVKASLAPVVNQLDLERAVAAITVRAAHNATVSPERHHDPADAELPGQRTRQAIIRQLAVTKHRARLRLVRHGQINPLPRQ